MARRRGARGLVALLLLSIWLGIAHTSIQAQGPSPSPIVRSMVEAVSEPSLSEYILHLQDDPQKPGLEAQGSRYSFSPGLAQAAGYIGQQFATAGLAVEYDTFVYGGTVMTNVVGTLAGLDSDRIYILSAHYDSTASLTPEWDPATDPAPGADDDGSGTAVVVEAARVLGGYRFAHTLRFIAFAGEEQGLRGSAHYAQEAREAGDDIGGVIQLDMIGYNPACDKLDISGNEGSMWLVEEMADNATQYSLDLTTERVTADYHYSDHTSFWERGYSAILAIEDYEPWEDSACYTVNPYYHTVNDTYETLNMNLVTKATQLVVATLAELAEPWAPDVAIVVGGPPIAEAGAVITYTLSYSNAGAELASQVVITDYLPTGLSYVADDSGLPRTELACGTHRWEVGELSPGEGGAFVVTATVGADLAPGTVLTNRAEIGTASLEGAVDNNGSDVATLLLWRLYLPLATTKGP
ncbi:MAG: M20/M25/M40 family metallo-hydrolase [Anaerolineae bacterium]